MKRSLKKRWRAHSHGNYCNVTLSLLLTTLLGSLHDLSFSSFPKSSAIFIMDTLGLHSNHTKNSSSCKANSKTDWRAKDMQKYLINGACPNRGTKEVFHCGRKTRLILTGPLQRFLKRETVFELGLL